uniref:AMP-dependent synthetase/ligase domain-containing protein n=1 Tax=Corethron hystrix TaxID=216773 RepID=A0A7S1BTK0_9STRA
MSLGLQDRFGIGPGSVVATDLPNVAEGILLHLACARLGSAIATAKNEDMLRKIPNVKCAVATGETSWLMPDSCILAGSGDMNDMLQYRSSGEGDDILDMDRNEQDSERALGFFNNPKALTHGSALSMGSQMLEHFHMVPRDKVCVSITLYHAFGIGSACSSALLSGAAIVLPAVGGLRGCGVPSQRAEVTLETLEKEQCTLLFADTHTLKALHDNSLREKLNDANLSNLRGGVCKTGSGTEILNDTVELKGVTLATLGKKK